MTLGAETVALAERLRSRTVFLTLLALCAGGWVLHALLLPVQVTYDGYEYLRLAKLLCTPEFTAEYYYARPPLYPALLRLSMELFGENPWAIRLPGWVCGFAGIVLLASAARKQGHALASLFILAGLALYPDLIAYSHAVLTESGTFFCLALWVWILARPWQSPFWGSVALGLAGALAYYQRPTLLYLAPLVAVLWMAQLHRIRRQADAAAAPRPAESFARRRVWLWLLEHGALAALIPFLCAAPWQQALERTAFKNTGGVLLLFGALKQGLFEPHDPEVAMVRSQYETALREASVEGALNPAGIPQDKLIAFQWDFIAVHDPGGERVFWRGVQRQPMRYAAGVLRSLYYFGGAPGLEDENGQTVREICGRAGEGSRLTGWNHPAHPAWAPKLAQKTDRTLLSRGLGFLRRPYVWAQRAATLLALIALVCCVLFRRADGLSVWLVLPFGVFALHAAALLSVNRYTFPAQPLLLAAACLIVSMALKRVFART